MEVVQQCLARQNCVTAASCTESTPASCLFTPIAPWRHDHEHLRCCFRCCVASWMAVHGLAANENHWLTLISKVKWHEQSDDWIEGGLLKHGGGDIVLGHMSMALLAHGNVFSYGRGVEKLKLVPGIKSVKMLVLHSNSQSGVPTLFAWLKSAVGQRYRLVGHRSSLRLVTRDDSDLPSAHGLQEWRRVHAEWPVERSPFWLVQNNAAPQAEGLFSFPIGVRYPHTLIRVLKEAGGREARVAHRHTLLSCCCMQTHLDHRKQTLSELRGNGFACDESDLPRSLRVRVQPPGSNSSAISEQYYLAMLESKFVASPRGFGRDCYRTWEALALGAIPVLCTRDFFLDAYSREGEARDVHHSLRPSRLDKFSKLPIVWVDSWHEVTPLFLRQEWQRLRAAAEQGTNVLDLSHAYFPFWLGELLHASQPQRVKRLSLNRSLCSGASC
mmetsp:Transcript_28409/g.61063  ORF Transcript_28409/g.61063 Transcript_28409/m.61063 type:complete len:442 (-) Transcript_28409:16-1341(-)